MSSLDQFPNNISLNRPQFAYDKIFLKLYYPFKNPTTRQFQNNTYDWVTFSANGQKWQKRHLKMAVSLWWGHSPLADVTAGANFCQGYWFRIWYFEKMTETNSIYRWISHMKVMTTWNVLVDIQFLCPDVKSLTFHNFQDTIGYKSCQQNILSRHSYRNWWQILSTVWLVQISLKTCLAV